MAGFIHFYWLKPAMTLWWIISTRSGCLGDISRGIADANKEYHVTGRNNLKEKNPVMPGHVCSLNISLKPNCKASVEMQSLDN